MQEELIKLGERKNSLLDKFFEFYGPDKFYLIGICCFIIVFLCNFYLFMINFSVMGILSKLSNLAYLVFDLGLVFFFYWLYLGLKQDENIPKLNSEDFEIKAG